MSHLDTYWHKYVPKDHCQTFEPLDLPRLTSETPHHLPSGGLVSVLLLVPFIQAILNKPYLIYYLEFSVTPITLKLKNQVVGNRRQKDAPQSLNIQRSARHIWLHTQFLRRGQRRAESP